MAKKSQKITSKQDGVVVNSTITYLQVTVHYQVTDQISIGSRKFKPTSTSDNVEQVRLQITSDEDLNKALESITGAAIYDGILSSMEKNRYEATESIDSNEA